ncbi:hypothetical protein [Coleofasciculus sp. FACHB-129]|nr:hypothetical protein [Coleofasciculus sp. FACHB-129]
MPIQLKPDSSSSRVFEGRETEILVTGPKRGGGISGLIGGGCLKIE